MTGIEDWLRYVFGLLAVLGLILLAARGIRLLNDRGLPGSPRRHRRLGIEEFLPLDARRRLVLLRHDEQEYLVLLGHQGETLLNVGPRPAGLPDTADTEPQDRPGSAPPGIGGIAQALYRRLRSGRARAGLARDASPATSRWPPGQSEATAAQAAPKGGAERDDTAGEAPRTGPQDDGAPGGSVPRTVMGGQAGRPHGRQDNGE